MEVAFTWSLVEVNDKIMNPQNIWKRIEALYLSVPLSLYPYLESISFFPIIFLSMLRRGFPGVSVVKNLPTDARDARHTVLIPESGRSPGEGNDNPLQYSCLENFMDKGAWWATVHGVTKIWARLSDLTFTFHFSLSCTGEGNGNPLQCACLENPRDRGA